MKYLDKAAALLMATALVSVGLTAVGGMAPAQEKHAKIGEAKSFAAPHDLKVTVRVMKPQDQEADVLFLCFFKHKENGDQVLSTIQEFDDRLGGLIAALRKRGEFHGDELETILIGTPPRGSIKAKQLMLIGVGAEEKLSLSTMRRIGTVALREAVRLGARRAAFGAALRDQGNKKLPTGDVGYEVIQGAILAFDTEKRLQKEGLAAAPGLQEWIFLAGPEYFLEVAPRAGEAVAAATAAVKGRPGDPYTKQK